VRQLRSRQAGEAEPGYCHNDNHAGVLLDHLAGCCAGGDET